MRKYAYVVTTHGTGISLSTPGSTSPIPRILQALPMSGAPDLRAIMGRRNRCRGPRLSACHLVAHSIPQSAAVPPILSSRVTASYAA